MKNRPTVFRMALAVIAVCLGVPGDAAKAQNASMTNASASTPPAVSAPQAPALPYGAGEVLKLYQGGINKDVIVNYIDSTALPYHLTADGIIYLQSLGLPQEITKAMIQRDGQLQQQAMQHYSYQQEQVPGPVSAPNSTAAVLPPGEEQVVTPATPAPSVTVIGSDYPYYGYGYPYYYGGAYYGWPLVIGGGWGWGWGHGGYRGGFGGFHGGGSFHGGFGGGHGGGHH
jgi:hypothetical protein